MCVCWCVCWGWVCYWQACKTRHILRGVVPTPRLLPGRLTPPHASACPQTLRGNIRALDFISDEMTRLRAQLKSGELSDVRLTYFELEGLTIAMESHLEWAQVCCRIACEWVGAPGVGLGRVCVTGCAP